MRFFEGLLSGPNNWEENPPQRAIEEQVIARPEADVELDEIEAEIVEPAGEPANDTPPHIAKMIKNGAFDRKPWQ